MPSRGNDWLKVEEASPPEVRSASTMWAFDVRRRQAETWLLECSSSLVFEQNLRQIQTGGHSRHVDSCRLDSINAVTWVP